jgi:hypothetical protein
MWGLGFPDSFEQVAISKANEDGVERARAEPDITCQVVSMAPCCGLSGQGAQHQDGLWGQATGVPTSTARQKCSYV